ncbi:hypothetical protein F5B22DRAFT_237321 [Xylaria bambusicola]|uniref:uncharacterized protein n=1 Tax=Xylaria bambusicola TaxID=326684 RepID=UPI0020075D2B|nr:uncharacterized protein F5B22DRAFT_237321 [Xylaria bambusicola]KAI0514356.1 hypothetical protein F5B22DRAFT_237321 [Xylaria bambusicola]
MLYPPPKFCPSCVSHFSPINIKAKKVNQSQPTHITLVSSELAAFTKFKERNNVSLLASFDVPGKVDPLDRMFVAKLLSQFFLSKLCEVVPSSVALINCSSPGSCHSTEYNRGIEHTFSVTLIKRIQRRVANKLEVGTRTITDAASTRAKRLTANSSPLNDWYGKSP